MLSSFLFIRWRKEKERGQKENKGQTLALGESGRCLALVAVKDMLWRIRSRDRMLPPKGMCRMDERAFSSPNPRDVGFLLVARSFPAGNGTSPGEPLRSVVVLLLGNFGVQT